MVILTARVERIDHQCSHNTMIERPTDEAHAWQCVCGYVYGAELYRVVLNHDGPVVMDQESYTVCSRVAEALVNPASEINTEIGEVVDAIRKAYNHE